MAASVPPPIWSRFNRLFRRRFFLLLAAGLAAGLLAVGLSAGYAERELAAGMAQTARGRLTHAVHVVEGRVARYRVQAPTDGFFADATALAALLANRRFVGLDQARQALEQAILALDPCLPYTLEVHDA